jgi:lysylphosphatidylglycerol synthetase-like protein (DUF2156 family)
MTCEHRGLPVYSSVTTRFRPCYADRPVGTLREFSLGNAPLAGLEARRGASLSTRLGALVYRHGRQFYNFEGLRAFKDKFDPDWRPVYVAIPPRANILVVATDVVSLISKGRPALEKT